MVDLNDYFNPVSIDKKEHGHLSGAACFSHNITIHTENTPVKDLGRFRIAIVGVPDGRNSPDEGSALGPDAIRNSLYQLSRIPGKSKIIDLGNMKRGVSFSDSVAGLTDILTTLTEAKIFPMIIGGSSALAAAVDRCLSASGESYTLATIDSRIDFQHERKESDSLSYLYPILYGSRSSVGHFINIGYQTFLNDQQTINRLLKKRYELVRIGDVRQAIHFMEPLLRDSHAAIFDISAVRQSDAPGTFSPSPNGFYGEEICLLARYAGISDSLRIFGLFEVNPSLDQRNQTSNLAAQIIWFFLEGFAQKQYESPVLSEGTSGRFTKYHVRVTDLDDDLIFIKSNLTDRWWFEIRTPFGENRYISCSQEDYLRANRNEVPDRWIRAVDRLSS